MPLSGLESYGADRQWIIPTICTSSSLALTTQDGDRSGPIGDETMMMNQLPSPTVLEVYALYALPVI